jgi:hypothetical protein
MERLKYGYARTSAGVASERIRSGDMLRYLEARQVCTKLAAAPTGLGWRLIG